VTFRHCDHIELGDLVQREHPQNSGGLGMGSVFC